MTLRRGRRRFAAAALVCLCGVGAIAAQARRVVDVVTVGVPSSEFDHEFSGDRVSVGTTGGRAHREALGWQQYVLTVFEDSDVTVVCTFRGTSGEIRRYALDVEGVSVPVPPFRSASAAPVEVEVHVPPSLTRRRTMVAIRLRGVDGPTPALMQIRTVQEHLEVW